MEIPTQIHNNRGVCHQSWPSVQPAAWGGAGAAAIVFKALNHCLSSNFSFLRASTLPCFFLSMPRTVPDTLYLINILTDSLTRLGNRTPLWKKKKNLNISCHHKPLCLFLPQLPLPSSELLGVWLEASYLTSFGLSFFVCEVGIVMAHSSKSCGKD